jgi:protoporphyrin/coproporphyrin ferrochelatase
MKKGVLLINLGTPDSPRVSDVRGYLRQFLSDPRVIDLPLLLRYLIVYCFILPFRARKSSHAYQSVWTNKGSPLLIHSLKIADKLQQELGNDTKVVLAMRYGKPSINHALAQLRDYQHLKVIPLFPQYSSAATGSTIEAVLNEIKQQTNIPFIEVIREFYDNSLFIETNANLIKKKPADFYLFSYHGLPERHIKKAGCKQLCHGQCPTVTNVNQFCYKAQCYETTRLIAKKLKLSEENYSTSFQSRLGKAPWISPYTDDYLTKLIEKKVKNITIICPSFVADCLETLEEIGIQARTQWKKLGGEQFHLVPCVNDDDSFIAMLKGLTLES